MKLATLKNGKPDGELVIVSRDLARMARAADMNDPVSKIVGLILGSPEFQKQ